MNKTDKNLCPCIAYITVFIQFNTYNELHIMKAHCYVLRIWLINLGFSQISWVKELSTSLSFESGSIKYSEGEKWKRQKSIECMWISGPPRGATGAHSRREFLNDYVDTPQNCSGVLVHQLVFIGRRSLLRCLSSRKTQPPACIGIVCRSSHGRVRGLWVRNNNSAILIKLIFYYKSLSY